MSPKPNDLEVDLSKIGVAIATPCYGNAFTGNYVKSLYDTVPRLLMHGINYNLITVTRDAILPKARNWIANEFLNTKMDYLLMVDSDMGWNGDAVLRLLARQLPFIAAAGPKKKLPMEFCANLIAGDDHIVNCIPELGLLEASEVGTGFLLCHRSVFEEIRAANPDYWFHDPFDKDKKIYRFFEELVEDHVYYSEDYAFCKKWRSIGGKIYVDPHIELEHMGEQLFVGKMVDYLTKKEDVVNAL